MVHDWEDVILELGGEEGFRGSQLKVRAYLHGPSQVRRRWGTKNMPIRLYVKVIGFEDDHAPVRNWGYGKKDLKNGSH